MLRHLKKHQKTYKNKKKHKKTCFLNFYKKTLKNVFYIYGFTRQTIEAAALFNSHKVAKRTVILEHYEVVIVRIFVGIYSYCGGGDEPQLSR